VNLERAQNRDTEFCGCCAYVNAILHCSVDEVLPTYSMCGNCKTIDEVTHLGKVQNCKIILQFVSTLDAVYMCEYCSRHTFIFFQRIIWMALNLLAEVREMVPPIGLAKKIMKLIPKACFLCICMYKCVIDLGIFVLLSG